MPDITSVTLAQQIAQAIAEAIWRAKARRALHEEQLWTLTMT